MTKQLNLVKALVNYKGKYLLLKKSKDAYFPENIGKWEFPGGIIEENETPEECVLRETKEETGLDCTVVKEFPELKSHESNCKVYLLKAESDNIILSNEHTEYKWAESKEVKTMPLVLYADLLLKYLD